ncbi:MAG: hypothetical protein EXS08_00630 [Planctomycetes bacterium]|nr:hypothetical protein [Planctomycetota bacterium]
MKPRRLLLALTCGGLVACAALEVGLRVLVLPHSWRPVPPFGAITHPDQAAWLAQQREELAGRAAPQGVGAFDAELGWVNRPGAHSPDGLYTIHAGGWRGTRDYARVPPAGVTRLVAFGESFTFGHELADAESWEAQLEALDARLELVNFGVGGYGTDQALLLAERELPRLHAEVVLIGLLLENIGRNVTRYRPLWAPNSNSPLAKPRFVLRDGELALVPLPFRTRTEFLAAVESGAVLSLLGEHEYWRGDELPVWLSWSAGARLWLGRQAYDRRRIDRLWSEPGEPFDVTLALLERFRTLARAQGARDALVLIFPAKPDLERLAWDGQKYWTRLLDELERRGIPHLDLTDVLAAEASVRGIPSIYRVSHLSSAANAVVARELSAYVRAWSRIPEPPRGERSNQQR